MGSGTGGSNVLAQVMAAVSQVETLKNEVLTLKTAISNKVDEAAANAVLSRKWANEAEDKSIETGAYSALHYAKKSEAWSEAAKKGVYGYVTTSTGTTKAGYWFKLFAVTLRLQGDDINGLISLLGGCLGDVSQGRALLWFRIKQEAALGSAPAASLKVATGSTEWIATSRLKAVITKNDSSGTELTFYVCIPNANTDVGYSPLHLHWPTTADVSVSWADSDEGVAELPSGTQISCESMVLN